MESLLIYPTHAVYIFITCCTVDLVSLKSLTTWGVLCSRYSNGSEKSQPAKMYPKPGRDHVWFMFYLGRQKWAMDDSLICIREPLLCLIFFCISKWNRTGSQWGTDAQKELATRDLSAAAACGGGRQRRAWFLGSLCYCWGEWWTRRQWPWAPPLRSLDSPPPHRPLPGSPPSTSPSPCDF